MAASGTKPQDASLTESETDDIRSKIGQLPWFARQSRLRKMFYTCIFAANIKHASGRTLHE